MFNLMFYDVVFSFSLKGTANSEIFFRITSVTSTATTQNPNILEWFYINPQTGQIVLGRSFLQDPGVARYDVSLSISVLGPYERNSLAIIYL